MSEENRNESSIQNDLYDPKISDSFENIFFEAEKMAQNIKLNAVKNRNTPAGTDVEESFPIDIRGLIEHYGVRVCETSLNADTGFCVERKYGYIRTDWEKKLTIYVENSDSEFVKRYVLAHELCHYFFRLESPDKKETSNCIDPLFPKDIKELFADAVAAYLLFPPKLVLKYMDQYKKEMQEHNIYPLEGEEWIRRLGQKAQVTTYYTISSYQYLKFYFCAVNQTKKKEYTEMKNFIKKYEVFFK